MTMMTEHRTASTVPPSLYVDSDNSDSWNYIPESNWSNGDTPRRYAKNPSQVHWNDWLQIINQPGYNQQLATYLDRNGVTADQFHEAFNVMGSASFHLGILIPQHDPDLSILKSFLNDRLITKDMRYAYYLVRTTVKGEVAEVVAHTKKIGYDRFFSYASAGLTLEQMKGIDENGIDPALIESLISETF